MMRRVMIVSAVCDSSIRHPLDVMPRLDMLAGLDAIGDLSTKRVRDFPTGNCRIRYSFGNPAPARNPACPHDFQRCLDSLFRPHAVLRFPQFAELLRCADGPCVQRAKIETICIAALSGLIIFRASADRRWLQQLAIMATVAGWLGFTADRFAT